MKHVIIKEIMFICEICRERESYNNHYLLQAMKEARKEGWSIIKGKTTCPSCKIK